MSSSTDTTATAKITPEVLRELLRYYNLSRREFIHTYNIQPLVYIPELPARAKTTFVVMYVIIFALALVGNSLVVYIVVRKRAMRTATNIFICSLAVSDLLITFFCIPFTLLQNISSEWLGGVLVCKTVPFVQTTAIVTGILTMTCIAIERYQGIVYPLKMKRQYTPKRAYRMLGEVRLPVRSSSRMLSGALAFTAAPSALHHLHDGGSVPAAAGRHALPLQPHRHRALDPQACGRLLGPQHHEPQRDQQDLQKEEARRQNDDHHRPAVHHLLGSVSYRAHAVRVQRAGEELRRGDGEHDHRRGAGHRLLQLLQQPHRLRLHERELQEELSGVPDASRPAERRRPAA
ncbi:uncharacterized protein qrfprb isoform X2 [Puntigrus tetrazona]|uniref:uncharacterized protein qrfprb isoform X2 n=1 Tax=Puntigrus tetrazona TaxID=1606681 RepID=UPI001C8984F9|nr:uncharacterized protein qrfprb isoform X2 [Puntigrus tetrazona]